MTSHSYIIHYLDSLKDSSNIRTQDTFFLLSAMQFITSSLSYITADLILSLVAC